MAKYRAAKIKEVLIDERAVNEKNGTEKYAFQNFTCNNRSLKIDIFVLI